MKSITHRRVHSKPQPGEVAGALALGQPIVTVYALTKEAQRAFKVDPPHAIGQVAGQLQRQGFCRVPVGSVAEAYRLRHSEGAIAILYRTGAILCQGTQAERLVAFLDCLMAKVGGGQ
jgi:hypothetical protein